MSLICSKSHRYIIQGWGKQLLLLPMISKVSAIGNSYEFEFEGTDEQAYEILANLMKDGFKIIDFGFKQQNLESIFMNITKGDVQ